ncbi:tripartite motif-containing protein 75-like [Erinaceus europaeus]|uniref:Tripartite motif-containing protein 75-like n=1 Tax=Erinaceus europaeus TaxID=9365 RepID=A0ABM3VTX7_ERIEU|nr:tripartite motif-containing protein 75-like [Erinaceus europaeus]
MAQECLLEEQTAELSCPVCLDLMTDPVTLECGHHCYASCLQQRWQDLLDIFPCPVCQHHCAHRKLHKKNRQLSALVDMLKQLSSTRNREQQQEQLLCEQHQQVLSLFCEQDLQLVCVQCRVSCEQQGHPLTPVKEAVAQHRKKFKSHLQTLKKQLKDAKRGQEMQSKEITDFLKEVAKQEYELHREFQQFKQSLRISQKKIDKKLQSKERQAFKKITEIKSQVSL